MSDQIYVSMSRTDWDRLLTVLQDATHGTRRKDGIDVVGLIKRLAHNANHNLIPILAQIPLKDLDDIGVDISNMPS